MENKKKKVGIFTKINCKEDALKIIKDSSLGFFFVAVIQAGVGYFIAPSLIIDAVLFAILATILLICKSRIAAILLFLFGGLTLSMTFLNKVGVTAQGGNNIFLALIIFWIAIRAVESTFKLHGKFSTENTEDKSKIEN